MDHNAIPDPVNQEFEDELTTLFDEIVAWLDRRRDVDHPDDEYMRSRTVTCGRGSSNFGARLLSTSGRGIGRPASREQE
jgi:hypothetical protein